MRKTLYLVTLFLWALPCFAQATYNAATCSLSAVQAAYTTEQASKVDGDVINVPSCGSTTWASNWTISPTNSLTFQGQSTTSVSSSCTPGVSCTHTDNTTITLGNTVQIKWTVASGKFIRVTGFSWLLSGSTAEYGSLTFGGAGSYRFDHNYVDDTISGDHSLQFDNVVNSVMDHNYIESTNSANLNFFQVTDEGADLFGDTSWTQPENFGGSAFLFVEDNFFTGGFLYDCDYGGRVAFRYNKAWYGSKIQTHGTGSGNDRRGCRASEVYNNTITFTATPNTSAFAFLVDYEGGPMMFWGNTITGFVTVLREQEVRANNASYTQTATPNGWGYCGTNFNGTGSAWDGSSSSASGYPCIDQVGRGAGQLLTGSFPSKVNNSTGTIAWPNQTLVPTYSWMNTQNTNTFSTNHFWGTFESPARVTENVEYYNPYPNVDHGGSFTGAGGTGYGVLASRPATCTTGVAYWETDHGQLDFCNSTNTWSTLVSSPASYVPYTYPNPLISGTPCSNPSIVPGSQIFFNTFSATVSAACTSIIYTTDGSTPTASGACAAINGTLYTVPVSISSTTTLSAIACQSGSTTSGVTIANYTLSTPAPSVPMLMGSLWFDTQEGRE